MNKNKWTVLLVGGSSGIGKTRITKELFLENKMVNWG